MKLLPSQNIVDSPELVKSECLMLKQKIQPRKRTITSASLLAVSFKMGMISSCEPSPKRARVSKEALVKESFSALAALHKAFDHVNDVYEENTYENDNSVPNVVPSFSTGNMASSGSLDVLHDVCMKHANNKDEVARALQLDPQGAMRRSSPLVSTGAYSLPINIALKNKASIDVLQLLVNAAPSAVVIQDGYDNSASLNIALRNRPVDISVVMLLVVANPLAVAIADSRGNYPIHVACACGAPLDVINTLHSLYPEASSKRNIHGEVPLDIVKRNTKCRKEILDFLHKVSKN